MLKYLTSDLLKIFFSTSRASSTSSHNSHLDFLAKYDPQQVTLLYEPLMIVDHQDQIIREATKKDAHLLSNIENQPTLIHRAFSFFLFNNSTSPSRLILQQRSSEKITYPSLWANTCCSHPLYNKIEMNGIDGVKHAVIRRVKYELGYEVESDLTYLTRIFYQARNIPDDGIFGESEIDYIIIAKHKQNEKLDLLADFQLNQNEVKQIKSVTLEQCQDLVQQDVTTPWFTKIVQEGLLEKWWAIVDNKETHRQTNEIIQL